MAENSSAKFSSLAPILAASADGRTISGELPWSPFAGEPPRPVNPLGWYFFNPGEAATIEAIVDKLEANGYRTQLLLEEIVLSTPFRNRNEVSDRPAPKKPAKPEKKEK